MTKLPLALLAAALSLAFAAATAIAAPVVPTKPANPL